MVVEKLDQTIRIIYYILILVKEDMLFVFTSSFIPVAVAPYMNCRLTHRSSFFFCFFFISVFSVSFFFFLFPSLSYLVCYPPPVGWVIYFMSAFIPASCYPGLVCCYVSPWCLVGQLPLAASVTTGVFIRLYAPPCMGPFSL